MGSSSVLRGAGSGAVDALIAAAAWLRKGRKVAVDAGARVNLGSGPVFVAPGWVNVDASAHLLVRRLPTGLLRLLLRFTDVGPACAATLKSERFVFHSLAYGIPFGDATVDVLYTSHVLEHLRPEDVRLVLAESARVLRPGGVLRVVVPEVGEAEDDHHERTGRLLDRHRTRFTAERLRALLRNAGFDRVERRAHGEGACPDLDLLENRPGSLVFEAYR